LINLLPGRNEQTFIQEEHDEPSHDRRRGCRRTPGSMPRSSPTWWSEPEQPARSKLIKRIAERLFDSAKQQQPERVVSEVAGAG
jgi:hypothetical protein